MLSLLVRSSLLHHSVVSLFILLLLGRVCDSRVVLGVAEGGHWAVLGDFCFHLPKTTDEGHILAQTLVGASGNELLLLKGSEPSGTLRLSANRHSLLLSRPYATPLFPQEANEAVSRCRAIQAAARVREPLKRSTYDTGSKPSLSLFELTLRIAQDLNHQTVTAVLVNCDGPLNVEYRVAFDNGSSGGGFTQFSCTEQGLLAAFGYFTVISGALFLLVFTYRQSHKQLLETTSAAPKALLVSAGSYFLSQLLTLCHLVAYASDGIGLNAFQFLGQLINCVSSTLLCCVLMWWCHGGSISASVISDQQQTNMNRCCLAFGATSLLYTLVQTELSVDQAPFFVPTDWCAIPHIVVRLAVAAYAYGCASTLKRAERRTDKRFFYGFLRGM
eukprot:GHVS01101693.1.p1 GENE.GHVS01101693.1~~GHVS01101693.1.p1  ORF type:complete len:387 (+),score=31.95 GHVS01101693.1:121-1281(+)